MSRKALLSIGIALILSACGSVSSTSPSGGHEFGLGSGGGGYTPAGNVLYPDRDQLIVVGDTLTMRLVLIYPASEIYWESSSSSLALSERTTEIFPSGANTNWTRSSVKVQGAAPGEAQVSALVGGQSFKRQIHVIPLSDVSSVWIALRTVSLKPDEAVELTATATDVRGGLIDSKPVFTLDDPSVASLGYERDPFYEVLRLKIRGVKSGRTILKAMLGNAVDSVAVSVTQ